MPQILPRAAAERSAAGDTAADAAHYDACFTQAAQGLFANAMCNWDPDASYNIRQALEKGLPRDTANAPFREVAGAV